MAQQHGLDRRMFLKSAGMTALAGAVGSGASLPTSTAAVLEPPGGTYDFDTIYSRVGTDCIKWDRQIATYGKDKIAVGMGIADLDFRAAPCITRALAERCQHENWGYLAIPDSYIKAIADWNKRRYGLEIDPDTVALTTGVHPGLVAALKAFAPPRSRVLLTTPVYNGFYSDLRFTQTVPEDSLMTLVDGRYAIDFDDFERRARRSNVFILCNPQNPTGNCWSAEDLLRMGEICLRHRVVVLADEIHCDFVTNGNRYTPFASLPNTAVVDNSLTFKAASKSFSLAAMKAAWFFSTNRDYLERVKAQNWLDLSTLGMVANHAALTEGDDWLEQCVAYIDGNHDYAESFIKANIPLVKHVKPQGTYLAWLDVSAVAERIDAKRLAAEADRTSATPVTPEIIVERWLVEHAGVHLNAGSSYGTGGDGRMRMNLGTSRQLVKRALENMAGALNRLT